MESLHYNVNICGGKLSEMYVSLKVQLKSKVKQRTHLTEQTQLL